MTSVWNDIREMLAEQVQFRELLYQMTRRDMLLRYKQTVMGFAWAIFMPLVNTVVFSVVFTRVAPIKVPVPYPVFAYCGLLAWNFFASSLRFSVVSLTSNTSLVTKVYFPREIFPFSAVLVGLIDFLVAGVVLAALMVYYHVAVGPAIVLLPVVVLVHVIFTCAIALLVAMANLFFRDVKYLFEIVINIWMFLTSVLYPVHLLGGRLTAVMQLNPMTPIIDAYRNVILLGRPPDLAPFSAAAVIACASLAAAWVVFHRAEFRFAENV